MRLGRAGKVVLGLLAAATFGILVFAVLASRAISVERLDAASAAARFDRVHDALGRSAAPLLVRDGAGRFVRNPDAPPARSARLTHLQVLAYRQSSSRLVQADVPFWFFRLKAPAAQYVVRDTGFDLETLGLTAADLEAQGPGVVLDEPSANGDRYLIWTE